MQFPTTYKDIMQRIDQVDPVRYGKTRNFIDGAVTYLSPYISRGLITLPQVKEQVMQRGYTISQAEKFLQELAWREFFQRVWWANGAAIFKDMKQAQQPVAHHQLPDALSNASTGIEAIDAAIETLYQTGYMHNHVRMYVAGITCNLAKAHWWAPSQWMYYHLLDGDLASNSLSWQWVAGSFSSKKYIANQENINRYLHSNQHRSYLDHPYETLLEQPVPAALQPSQAFALTTQLPPTDAHFEIDASKPVCLYSSYWLNPNWRKDEDCNRILLLEPDHFTQFPVSDSVIRFITKAATENIQGLQIFTGSFEALQQLLHPEQPVYFIDHPLHRHYKGWADSYPWLFPQVTGSFGSFFAFWKKAERYLYK